MKKIFIITLFLATGLFLPRPFKNDWTELSESSIPTQILKAALNASLKDQQDWPNNFYYRGKSFQINYSLNKNLSDYIKKRIKRYHPEYVSVVVIDNNTGSILTAQDYDKFENKFGRNITFSKEHPAASVFKIITSAELLENGSVSINTPFTYTGKTTTLYKGQLNLSDRKRRWSRIQTFLQAFALSNNVIFGKAAIKYSALDSLYHMAEKFGFGQDLISEVNLAPSTIEEQRLEKREERAYGNEKEIKEREEEDKYFLAEIASGFNRITLMSPIHGAVMASIIANNGVFKKPHLVKQVLGHESRSLAWKPVEQEEKVISSDTASDLQMLMQRTITRGTAKSSFRINRRKLLNKLDIGGKTGTLTGGVPHGRRDWFVAYAKPKDDTLDKGISICVMIINVNKWYIKSPRLANDIIRYFYRSIL